MPTSVPRGDHIVIYILHSLVSLSGTDKPLHWLAYLGLAVVVVRAVAGGLPGRVGVWSAAVAMLITVGYAVTDEVHQMFVPSRSAEMYDLLADAAGAIAGTAACWA